MLRFGIPSRAARAQQIVNSIPDDGCVIIFNGNHVDFRKAAVFSGCLSCHALDPEKGDTRINRERDLYITWRGNAQKGN